METALSVCSQLLFLYCPLLLCMSLFFPKLTKNRVANVAALSCLGWTICGLEIQSNNFFLLIIQSHLPTWAAIVTGLTLIDCYFRLKPKPVPMLVNQCMNADNLSLEEMLDAAPFFILVALCIVLCAIKSSILHIINVRAMYVQHPSASLIQSVQQLAHSNHTSSGQCQ